MGDTQKVTVITVCRNSSHTIEKTILSVLEQTYPNVEYLIVDGASTDGTIDIIKRYEHRLTRWISEPDAGLYDAMNKGIRMATGDWVHLLNSDDCYFGSQSLARMMACVDGQSANYFSMVLDFPDGRRKLERFPFRAWKLYFSAYLPHPALIVSRAQYQATGFYDTSLRIAADHDFILRLLKQYPGKFHDFPVVVMGQEGLSAKSLERACREFMEVTVRHGVPAWLAYCFYYFKLLSWGLKARLRQLRSWFAAHAY